MFQSMQNQKPPAICQLSRNSRATPGRSYASAVKKSAFSTPTRGIDLRAQGKEGPHEHMPQTSGPSKNPKTLDLKQLSPPFTRQSETVCSLANPLNRVPMDSQALRTGSAGSFACARQKLLPPKMPEGLTKASPDQHQLAVKMVGALVAGYIQLQCETKKRIKDVVCVAESMGFTPEAIADLKREVRSAFRARNYDENFPAGESRTVGVKSYIEKYLARNALFGIDVQNLKDKRDLFFNEVFLAELVRTQEVMEKGLPTAVETQSRLLEAIFQVTEKNCSDLDLIKCEGYASTAKFYANRANQEAKELNPNYKKVTKCLANARKYVRKAGAELASDHEIFNIMQCANQALINANSEAKLRIAENSSWGKKKGGSGKKWNAKKKWVK